MAIFPFVDREVEISVDLTNALPDGFKLSLPDAVSNDNLQRNNRQAPLILLTISW